MKNLITFLLVFPISFLGKAQLMNAVRPFQYQDVPVRVEMPVQPVPVKGRDGDTYLSYHIFLTNLAVQPVMIKKITVSEPGGRLLLTFGEKDLEDYYKFHLMMGVSAAGQVPRKMAAGSSWAAFFWVKIRKGLTVPRNLLHTLVFAADSGMQVMRKEPYDRVGEDIILKNLVLNISRARPVTIGLPFKQGDWKCMGGPGAYDTPHQFLVVREGRLTNPQRFAIDFSKVDTGGNSLPSPFPDTINNQMFYGYGTPLLAVADGRIVFVQDGVPQNVPQAKGPIVHASELNRKTYPGNWICLEIKKGVYAFYAHLQPGKMKVKVGDRVKKGQVMAYLGNSGNAAGPHLHFHIGDRFDTYGSDLNGNEGLPFVFDEFRLKKDPQIHISQVPLDNDIISIH